MRVLLALAAATALLLCGTAWRVARGQVRSAGCEMTYMYASYREVDVPRSAESDKRYKLYLYREDGGQSKQGATGAAGAAVDAAVNGGPGCRRRAGRRCVTGRS